MTAVASAGTPSMLPGISTNWPTPGAPVTPGGRNDAWRVSIARRGANSWNGDPPGPNHPTRSTMRSVAAVTEDARLTRRVDRDDRQVRCRSLRSHVDVRELRQVGAASVCRQEPGRQGPIRRDRERERLRLGRHRSGTGPATSNPVTPVVPGACRQASRVRRETTDTAANGMPLARADTVLRRRGPIRRRHRASR